MKAFLLFKRPLSPGAIKTELIGHIEVPEFKEGMRSFTDIAIDADAIACAIHFAIAQPANVDINEVIFQPSQQALWGVSYDRMVGMERLLTNPSSHTTLKGLKS